MVKLMYFEVVLAFIKKKQSVNESIYNFYALCLLAISLTHIHFHLELRSLNRALRLLTRSKENVFLLIPLRDPTRDPK